MATLLYDMEELLNRIERPIARDYMKEALSCYNAAAFRAAIVLSYIAVFDDLKSKIESLAKINADAAKIKNDLEKKIKDQKPYENDLTTSLHSHDFISIEKFEKLKAIITSRNKSAHPSGIHPSAEEARFIFFEVIDKFLSEQQLETTHYIDELLLELPAGNFFPSTKLAEISAIVEGELTKINPLALPYLLTQILKGHEGADEKTKKACKTFLRGLAAQQTDPIRKLIVKYIITKKSSDIEYATTIIALLTIDPKLANGLDNTIKSRISSFIEKVCKLDPIPKAAHPISWLETFINYFTPDAIYEEYKPAVNAILREFNEDQTLAEVLTNPSTLRGKLIRRITKHAASSQFSTANSAVKALVSFAKIWKDTVTQKEALRIVGSIYASHEHGAYDAKAVVNNKYKALPAITAEAKKFIKNDPAKAQAYLEEKSISVTIKDINEALEE